MMHVYWIGTSSTGDQRFGALCSTHPLETHVGQSAARQIMRSHRHNVDFHPRRARRDLRKLIS
jgi:hypothetical protein